jgi:hypothetical protein
MNGEEGKEIVTDGDLTAHRIGGLRINGERKRIRLFVAISRNGARAASLSTDADFCAALGLQC